MVPRLSQAWTLIHLPWQFLQLAMGARLENPLANPSLVLLKPLVEF